MHPLRILIAVSALIGVVGVSPVQGEPAVEPLAPLRDEASKDKSLEPLKKFTDDFSKVYYGVSEVSQAAWLAYKIAAGEDIEEDILDYFKDEALDFAKEKAVIKGKDLIQDRIRKILYQKAQRKLKKKMMELTGSMAELLIDDTVRVSMFAVTAFLTPNVVESKEAWERDIEIIARDYYVSSWRKRWMTPVRALPVPPRARPSDITGVDRGKPTVSGPRVRPSDITGPERRVGGVKVDVPSKGQEEDLGAARDEVLKLLRK